jgi:DNA-binding MarR family transcriptional regulator
LEQEVNPTDAATAERGHDPAETDALDAYRNLTLAAEEFRHASATHFGVGVTETVAMSYLAATGPMSARDLAKAMGLAPSSITSVLDRLESAGIATRSAVEGDRRAVLVTITPKGEAKLEWTRDRLRVALRSMALDSLPELTQNLKLLAKALRTQTEYVAGAEKQQD